MQTFQKCAIAAVAATFFATTAAHAHIPSECAVHVQELELALEGQDDTREHVDLVLQIYADEKEAAIRSGLLAQYARINNHVRHKALLLFGCIIEPPSVSSLPAE